MPTEIKETLEDVRNRLMIESRNQPEEMKPGYVNGILDMYNAIKKLQREGDKL